MGRHGHHRRRGQDITIEEKPGQATRGAGAKLGIGASQTFQPRRPMLKKTSESPGAIDIETHLQMGGNAEAQQTGHRLDLRRIRLLPHHHDTDLEIELAGRQAITVRCAQGIAQQHPLDNKERIVFPDVVITTCQQSYH